MAGSDKQNRRKYVRISPEDGFQCAVQGYSSSHIIGMSLNGGGLRLMLDGPVNEEETLSISLALEEEGAFDLKGRVVWSQLEDFGYCQRSIVGVEFISVPEKLVSHLEKLLLQRLEEERPENS